MKPFLAHFLLIALLAVTNICCAQQKKLWVTYDGFHGPGKGKHIVFITGDEEYRSEEAMPMLAQILAKTYGFTCTVLFSTDPKTSEIDAFQLSNIPGLEALQTADLMVVFTRFRELPAAQMKYIDAYLKTGKPVIGLRTATHAFYYQKDTANAFARYDYLSKAKGFDSGFGKQVLGETWINHHGHHGHEGTRALVNGIEQDAKNPLLNGVKDIWTPTDVYTVTALKNANVLLYGQSTSGMTDTSRVNLEKSVMPIAWTHSYMLPGGKKGKAFATTMGASIDFKSEDLRRLLVNATFWAVGLEKQIPERANVDFVSEYKPTMFSPELFKKGRFASDFELK